MRAHALLRAKTLDDMEIFMEEVLRPEPVDVSPATQLKPQGIGMAVAFDWGIAVQVLVTPFLPLILGQSGPGKFLKMNPQQTALVSFLISLPAAILLIVFGEGVRRGWRWTRPVQIVGNVLLTFAGISPLLGLLRGDYWRAVPAVILLIFSPLIAWRLSRPVTARWFAAVKSSEARKRHGGLWVWMILLWSIAGGVLEALSTFH